MFLFNLVRLAAARAPVILCGSVSLRAGIRRDARQLGNEEDVTQMLSDIQRSFAGLQTSPVEGGEGGPAAHRRQLRDVKSLGLNTITRWCAAQQQQQEECAGESSSTGTTNSADLDVSVLQWVRAATPMLTCMQCMLLVSILGDVLCRRLDRGALSVPPRSTVADENREDRLIELIVNVMALLQQHIIASDHLERQSLPVILSCLYALHRSQERFDSEVRAAGRDDDETQQLLLRLEPPVDVLLAMVHHLRSLFSPNADDDTKREKLEHTSLLEALLTFFVLMNPTRRTRLLAASDQSIAQSALFHLKQELAKVPHLSGSINALLHAHDDTSAADHALQKALKTLFPDDAADSTPAARAETSSLPVICLRDTLDIMRNVTASSPFLRLQLAYYLLVCRRDLSLSTPADAPLVAAILGSLDNIAPHKRLELTNGLVQMLPETVRSGSRLLTFLPFLKDSAAAAALGSLDDIKTKLTPTEASYLLALRPESGSMEWNTEKSLIVTVLRSHLPEEVLEQLFSPSDADPRTAAGVTAAIPLTRQVCAVVARLAAEDSGVGSAASHRVLTSSPSDTSPSPVETSLPAHVDHAASMERRCLSRKLFELVDWKGGVVEDVASLGSDASVTYSLAHSDNSMIFRVWSAYTQFFIDNNKMDSGVSSSPSRLSSTEILNHYGYSMLAALDKSSAVRGKDLATTLSVLPLVETREARQQFVDAVLRVTGTRGITSVILFLLHIEPSASEAGVITPDIHRELLKLHTLDPSRLNAKLYNVSDMGTSAQLRLHYRAVFYGVKHVYERPPWSSLDVREQRMVGGWISRFFSAYLTALKTARQGCTRDDANTSPDVTPAACSADIPDDALTENSLGDDDVDSDAEGDEGVVLDGANDEEEPLVTELEGASTDEIASELLVEGIESEPIPGAESVLSATKDSPQGAIAVSADELEKLLQLSVLTDLKIPSRMFAVVRSHASQWIADVGGITADDDSLPAFPYPAHFVFLTKSHAEELLPCRGSFFSRCLSRTENTALYPGLLSAMFRLLTEKFQYDDVLALVGATFHLLLARLRRDTEGSDKTPSAQSLDSIALSIAACFSALRRVSQQQQQEERHRQQQSVLQRDEATEEGPPVSLAVFSAATVDKSRTIKSTVAAEKGAQTHDEESTGSVSHLLSLRLSDDAQEDGVALLDALPVARVVALCLRHLEIMNRTAPRMAAHAFDKLRASLSTLPARDIYKTACLYPAGENALIEALAARHPCPTEIAPPLAAASETALESTSSVHPGLPAAAAATASNAPFDFNLFLVFCKKLSRQFVNGVVKTQVDHLSLRSCARLLNAVVYRGPEFLDAEVLQSVLKRMSSLGAATPPHTVSEERAKALISLQAMMESLTDTSQSVEAKSDHGPSSLAARLTVVKTCHNTLLGAEQITDTESLVRFLSAFPPTVQVTANPGVIRQARDAVLRPLLAISAPTTATPQSKSTDPADPTLTDDEPNADDASVLGKLKDVVAVLQLMQRHHLLADDVGREVLARIFQVPGPDAPHLFRAEPFNALVLQQLVSVVIYCANPSSAETQQDSDEKEPMHASPVAAALGTAELAVMSFDKIVKWFASSAAERLVLLSYLVELRQHGHTMTAEESGSGNRFLDQPSPGFLGRLVVGIARDCDSLSPSDFSKFAHHVSRLRLWSAVVEEASGFQDALLRSFARADGHSRCVLLRALAVTPSVFTRFEASTVPLVLGDVAVLSMEDLEVLLTAALAVSDPALVEALVDSIATRVQPVAEQCRISLLVRLLQCHSQFGLSDPDLFATVLTALQDKCTEEVKLSAAQILTLLQSLVNLGEDPPERLLTLCFERLERHINSLTTAQLEHAGRLCVDLEMGFTLAVDKIVSRILENRDALRGNPSYRAVVETLCDVYDVETSPHLRASRLRKRQGKERVADFYRAQTPAQVSE